MQLPHPITVIQLIRKKLTYGKALRAFDVRSKAVVWPATFYSNNGYVKNEMLFLTPAVADKLDPKKNNCLLLVDEINVNAESIQASPTLDFETFSSALVLSEVKQKVRWDVFAFQFNDNTLTTYFEWDYFKVGSPERDNHRLFDLSAKKVLNLQLNGKIDANMASGTRRYYQEMEYTFIYYGQFAECNPLVGSVEKPLLHKPDKKINMLKTLY